MEQLLKNLGSIGGLDLVSSDGSGDLGIDTDLPRDVDEAVMQALESSIGQQEQENKRSIEVRLARCRERQNRIESRYQSLQKRINLLRAQKISQHAADQIQSVLGSCDKRLARLSASPHPYPAPSSSSCPFPKVDEEEEEAVTEPATKEVSRKVATKTGASGNTASAARRSRFRRFNKAHADRTLGKLHHSLRHIQALLDPEATESSSGGESADEADRIVAVAPSGPAKHYAPIQERAKYRWLQKRAEYASQWVWLQGQISDLEYKIRQHTELYKAQRAGKGAVTLGVETGPWGLQSQGTSLRDAYRSSHAGHVKRPVELEAMSDATSEDELTMTCSRVRPVNKVRRRRIIDTHSLHHALNKSSKPSGVWCSCLPPEQRCLVCLGRREPPSLPDVRHQSREECVALLDHSYHSVLSSRSETSLNVLLMEGLLKRRWVNRPSHPQLPPGHPAHLSRLYTVEDEGRERGIRAEVMRGMDAKRRGVRRPANRSIKRTKSEQASRPTTPELGGSSASKELKIKEAKDVPKIRDLSSLTEQMKRKRKSTFDIDHIVIPYSMAASTRVEKLKYKEIQTPSWRIVDETFAWPPPGQLGRKGPPGKRPRPAKPSTSDPEYEDIGDIVMAVLHAKAEEEERIRWATPLGRVHGGQRQRGNTRTRRLDSCRTEASSGANTPDPLSPSALDTVENIMVATRPSSPQEDPGLTLSTLITTNMAIHSTSTVTNPAPLVPLPAAAQSTVAAMPTPTTLTPASILQRRRTSSQTKSRDRNLSEASQNSQESSRSTSPWTEVEEMVHPWVMRQFPLTDEEAKLLEDIEDLIPPAAGSMRPPPPPDVPSAATSRTTSRSSSMCEDSGDPDWEDQEAEDEPAF